MIDYILDEMEDILDTFACIRDSVIVPILLDAFNGLRFLLERGLRVFLVLTVPLWIVPYLLIENRGGKA